jgi:hypothetical protein
MLNLSEKTYLSVYFPMESMTDPDSQRTKRMLQFYFQDLADETALHLFPSKFLMLQHT